MNDLNDLNYCVFVYIFVFVCEFLCLTSLARSSNYPS